MRSLWKGLLFLKCLLLLHAEDDHSFLKELRHIRKKRDAGQYIPPDSPWKGTDWNGIAKEAIRVTNLNLEKINTKRAMNVIIFIGDGMGVSTTSVARLYKAELLGRTSLKDMYLEWENFPFSSLVKTYTVDRTTPDSAATATAYLSGIKANLGTMGLNDQVYYTMCYKVNGNRVESILHKSIQQEKSTGVVTTTRITHATPAATYASTPHRDWEAVVPAEANPKAECSDIAHQLIHDERNSGIRVLFGGGARNFLPNSTIDECSGKPGKRQDGQNLIDEWLKKQQFKGLSKEQYKVVRSKKSFDELDVNKVHHVLGLFGHSHMSYELDRDPSKEPSLEEMTEKAIEILEKNGNGYFLLVEGGMIDTAHHENMAKKALSEVLAMEKAVKKALDLVDLKETLVIVTADHSHVFTMGGYALFQESVLGMAEPKRNPAVDGKPYQQLFYADGPGQLKHRIKMTDDKKFEEVPRKNLTGLKEIYDNDYQQDSGVLTMNESHGAEDVAVFAAGPWAHLFQGTQEQNYIAHVMMYASCVGDYTTEAHCTPPIIKSTDQRIVYPDSK